MSERISYAVLKDGTYPSTWFPTGIYLLEVNNRSTRTRGEICLKLTIRTPEQRHCCHSGVFFVNFEHISYLALLNI